MKRILTFIATVLMAVSMFAQSPDKMSYQAVVRNSNNFAVENQAVGVRVSILQYASTGASVYIETQTPTTNKYGLMTLEIGDGEVVLGTFSDLDWPDGPFFIKTEIDPEGGNSYTITGISQIMSVPYSMHSKIAENVINDAVNDADADPTNELQSLSFFNDTLFLSNDTGYIDLIDYNNSFKWLDSVTLYHDSATTIGIGSNTPATYGLLSMYPANNLVGIYMDHYKNTYGDAYGLHINVNQTYTGYNYAYGGHFSSYISGTAGYSYGLYATTSNYASGSGYSAYGVRGSAYRSGNTGNTYGIYGYASGGSSTQNWAGYFSGKVYATQGFTSSDRKLKSNIQPYTNSLTKLLQLNTYTYEFNNEKYKFMNLPEGPQIGLIAQDVEKLYPHLTSEIVQPAQTMPVKDAADSYGEGNYTVNEKGMAVVGEEITFMGVNYAGMVPILVEAIKEQQTQIAAQQAEIDALKLKLQSVMDQMK